MDQNDQFSILFRRTCYGFQTCLDYFPVDDNLSRRALADLHRLLVKADVGMSKVVFEGVHLFCIQRRFVFCQSFSYFPPETTVPCT